MSLDYKIMFVTTVFMGKKHGVCNSCVSEIKVHVEETKDFLKSSPFVPQTLAI